MFSSARLKLAAWYAVISVFISATFSFIIYRGISEEIDRFALQQRVQFEQRIRKQLPVPRVYTVDSFEAPLTPGIEVELLHTIKQRVLTMLVLINAVIAFCAAGIGYLLAGKVLRPIQEMMEEQRRFVADASHELRTPLAGLKSGIEINLRDPKLSLKDARDVLKSNLTDVNTLEALTSGLLQLAEYEQVNGNLVRSVVPVSELVQGALQRVEKLAAKKKIKITMSVPSELRSRVDAEAMTQTLSILLENAVKYSPEHTEVNIKAHASGRAAIIQVKDHGPGISPRDLPHIFDRFYRANAARTKDRQGGYGLGLSIAKAIVEAHHGTISAASKLEKGSTFTITIPNG
jgi:two-component system, OmpR family, sensor histidine kinase CiaH